MDLSVIATIVTVVAMLTSALVFPFALKFARARNIVDKPDARKLQRSPVPVFGGVVVFSGILMGGIVLQFFIWSEINTARLLHDDLASSGIPFFCAIA